MPPKGNVGSSCHLASQHKKQCICQCKCIVDSAIHPHTAKWTVQVSSITRQCHTSIDESVHYALVHLDSGCRLFEGNAETETDYSSMKA